MEYKSKGTVFNTKKINYQLDLVFQNLIQLKRSEYFDVVIGGRGHSTQSYFGQDSSIPTHPVNTCVRKCHELFEVVVRSLLEIHDFVDLLCIALNCFLSLFWRISVNQQ